MTVKWLLIDDKLALLHLPVGIPMAHPRGTPDDLYKVVCNRYPSVVLCWVRREVGGGGATIASQTSDEASRQGTFRL